MHVHGLSPRLPRTTTPIRIGTLIEKVVTVTNGGKRMRVLGSSHQPAPPRKNSSSGGVLPH